MSSSLPDLDDLALLVAVARHASIGAAAAEHGLSQPSASRRMSALERRLGVRLLERSRRGTTLTASGQVIVDWAETLLNAAADFTRSVETLRRRRSTSLRVAVSMTIAEHLAPQWLAALRNHRPDLHVSLEVRNSAEVADLVESGGAALGFIETPQVRRGLKRRRIGADRLVIAVSPDHPWAQEAAITAADLADAALLLREPGSGTRETLAQALAARGLEVADGLVMSSNSALRSAAATGLGPVALAEVALASELAAGRLVEVAVADLDLARPLTAVWRSGDDLGEGGGALLRVAAAGVRSR